MFQSWKNVVLCLGHSGTLHWFAYVGKEPDLLQNETLSQGKGMIVRCKFCSVLFVLAVCSVVIAWKYRFDVMHELLLQIIGSACKQKVIFEVVYVSFFSKAVTWHADNINICFPLLFILTPVYLFLI